MCVCVPFSRYLAISHARVNFMPLFIRSVVLCVFGFDSFFFSVFFLQFPTVCGPFHFVKPLCSSCNWWFKFGSRILRSWYCVLSGWRLLFTDEQRHTHTKVLDFLIAFAILFAPFFLSLSSSVHHFYCGKYVKFRHRFSSFSHAHWKLVFTPNKCVQLARTHILFSHPLCVC